MKSLKDIPIAYKIHLPVILTILFAISVVILNSYFELKNIERHSRQDTLKQMQLYIKQSLKEKRQIGLTNAISLSLNQSVIKALNKNSRDTLFDYLQNLSSQFRENSDYKNIKIHIHDKNVRSFIRHWKLSEYGDDLSTFRDSLNFVKKNHKPIAVIEPGRAGMLLRGVAPIINGKEYLGSVEFIQGFNSVVINALEDNEYSLIFLTFPSERFKKFDTKTPMVGDMYLSQKVSNTNQELSSMLDKDDLSKIEKSDYLIKGQYFITAMPLFDVMNEKVGIVLVALPNNLVNSFVTDAKKSLETQVLIMSIAAIFVLIFLVSVLHYNIKLPINNLNNAMEDIKNSLSNKQSFSELNRLKINMNQKDEIGSIAHTINRLLKSLLYEFIKVQKSSKTTQEYVKAVNAGSIVSKSDLDGNITYVNQALCDITGYSQDELIGKPHNIFRHPNTPKQTFKNMWKTIKNGNIWHGILKNMRKDGTTFYANITIVPITNNHNKIIEYIALRDDVTELVNSKEELKKTFLTDPLTSFGNRFKMLEVIQKHPLSALAIIDIHYFKEINDFYGHQIGDKVIVNLGNKLFDFFSDESIEIFHLSGDEFSVVCTSTTVNELEFINNIEEFFSRFNHSEIIIGEHIIALRLTCGLSRSSDHVISHADIAHKNAKKNNKDIVIYSDEISTDIEYKKNLDLTKKIKNAINNNKIEAFFQPLYNNKTRKIDKYETLMRLIEDDGKEVSPFIFLDIAKKTRHYKSLTRIVVDQAFKKFENSQYEFSVNLSAEDIIMHNIGEYFFTLAKQHGVQNRVVIELVESEGIESFDTVETFIKEAKENGMKIAIDDFGTGYSNFEYLIRLNADFIKIDGSLIKTIDTDKNMRSVVETIVMFAKKNSMKTIAEYVATKEIQKVVDELEIDYSQGYYHGKPARELKL